MEVGNRVYVKTFLFEGMATVDYIAAMSELYPIQIELDKSDEDGHKLKRVALNEIVSNQEQQEEVQPTNTPIIAIEPVGVLQTAEITQNNKRYGLFIGDLYLIGPTRQNAGTHFYFYDAHTAVFKGCMPVGMFRVVDKDKVVRIERKPAIIEKIKPLEKPEQMSMFDFM